MHSIQERRELEDVVASMEENEREEIFDRTNKMERSRIINLAEKHCAQIMDLIHRSVYFSARQPQLGHL